MERAKRKNEGGGTGEDTPLGLFSTLAPIFRSPPLSESLEQATLNSVYVRVSFTIIWSWAGRDERITAGESY